MSRVAMWTMISVIKDSIFCASDVLAVSFLSDYRFYGSWTFPPARWLYFNLVQSLAVFYGRNPWHYYLSQGIPLLCIASLPWVLVGLYRAALSPTSIQTGTLGASVITTVAALSLITHKEVRFVYPLLPILQVLGAPGAAATFTERRDRSRGTDKAVSGARYGLRRVPMLATLLGLNVVLAFFLSALHQPAPVAVTTFLRHEFERVHPDRLSLTPPTTANNTEEDERFALFLTPCHSTPWRSHLVYPRLSVRALTCEPPLHTSPGTPEREGYRDEADRFYDDQLGFLRDELWSFAFVRDGSSDGRGAEQEQREKALPRYIVGFEGIEATLRAFFKQVQFAGFGEVRLRRVWEGWNGFANEDWRRRGKLVVWDTGVWDADEWGTE